MQMRYDLTDYSAPYLMRVTQQGQIFRSKSMVITGLRGNLQIDVWSYLALQSMKKYFYEFARF